LQSEKLASIGMLAAGWLTRSTPGVVCAGQLEALAELLQASDGKAKPDLKGAPKPGSSDFRFEAMNIVQESKRAWPASIASCATCAPFSRLDEDATLLTDANSAVDSAQSMLRSETPLPRTGGRDLRATKGVRAQRRPARAGRFST